MSHGSPERSQRRPPLVWLGAGQLAAEYIELPEVKALRATSENRFIGVRRRADKIAPGFIPMSADFNQPESLKSLALPTGHQLVVSLTPKERSDRGYQQAYVEASRNIIERYLAQGVTPSRVVIVSSTSVYGQNQGEVIDETSSAAAEQFSGRRLLEMEQLWLSSPWPVTCVRFSGIYGPGRYRLLQQVERGDWASSGDVQYTNRIHQTDCARVIDHVLQLPSPPEVMIGTDNDGGTSLDVKSWLASALGKAPAQGLAETNMVRGKRISNQRLRDSGFTLNYPSYREGYPAIVQQYLNQAAG